ncbi:hypothetical protein ECE50_008550 [Chitinophaga sp. Mgbs1]|uniref:Uncharacterized protein n=1 Tax=Chitinophaga solisilvae TaxID=1233460 RepID=A0A3S1D670_9BACT|nr:hypothetical protein [Chitinophaga solisilvae]
MNLIRTPLLILWMVVIIALSAYAQPRPAADNHAFPVGMTSRAYPDSARRNWADTGPRIMRTIIWYPAAGGGQITMLDNPGQFAAPVPVIRDGAFASSPPAGLIMISHGANGNATQMAWLGYYLAAHGYIAAAVEHCGTAEEERNIQSPAISEVYIAVLPDDISAVISQLQTDTFFRTHISAQRIGVAGFSLGGAVAIWTAGARLNMPALNRETFIPAELKATIEKLKAEEATDPVLKAARLHAGDDFRDKRIKAVFALAPAIGRGFPPASLQPVTTPVCIVVGDADMVTPPAANAVMYARGIKGAQLTVLPGEAGHFIRNQDNVSQAQILRNVSLMAIRFFDKTFPAQR